MLWRVDHRKKIFRCSGGTSPCEQPKQMMSECMPQEREQNMEEIIRVQNKDLFLHQNMLQHRYEEESEWNLEFLTFPGLSQIEGVRHLFSTRLGGVSKDIFSSMNLSFTRGDEDECVLENFKRIAHVMQTDVEHMVCSDQTHTTNVRVVTKEDAGKGVVYKKGYTDVDGLITNVKGLVLATFYADCVPLYFVDPVKKVIGLSHSGWRGTVAGMGRVTVEKMQEVYGCKPADIHAAIGPSICQACYEVSQEVADAYLEGLEQCKYSGVAFTAQEKKACFDAVFMQKDEKQISEQKYQMNLWKANELVMRSAGILPEHIEVTDICTCHNKDYLFSHRASNGRRGNLGAFLMLTESPAL